jgi:protein TonB
LGEEEPGPSVAVPSLADVPSIGPLTAFTQPLQPPAPPGLAVSKTLGTIPTHRGTGSTFGKGIGDLFDVNTLDQIPVARTTFPPDYPYEMRRQTKEGWVEVDYIVDRSGSVVAAQALRSSDEAFERPALDALRRWKFRPGRKGGRTVNSRIQQTIKFSLEADR